MTDRDPSGSPDTLKGAGDPGPAPPEQAPELRETTGDRHSAPPEPGVWVSPAGGTKISRVVPVSGPPPVSDPPPQTAEPSRAAWQPQPELRVTLRFGSLSDHRSVAEEFTLPRAEPAGEPPAQPLPDAGPFAPKTTIQGMPSVRAPATASPLIRITGSAEPSVITTQGELLDSALPAQMPATTESGLDDGRTDGGRTAAALDQSSLAQRPESALVPSRSGVMGALMAAIDALDATRNRDGRMAAPQERAIERAASFARTMHITPVERKPYGQRSVLAGIDAPDSARAETFRLLRHRLRNLDDPRLIAIVTPRAGDEAAFCAAELALAYADADPERVLLLEIDTQRPRLAQVMGLSVEHCFALQMYDKYDGSPEPWHAVSVFRNNLHVLAVNPSLSAGDRLTPSVFHHALNELSHADYGRLIIAGPRVLDSADVGLLGETVDGVLLTGRVGRTTTRELRRAAHQLAPARVLGVALLEPP